MTRRATLVFAAAVLAAIGTFSTSSPAKAECPYIPPYPTVTEAARSAREIVVGTVIENVGGQFYDFRFRIDHVLRGPAHIGDIRRVKSLYPKWPLDTTADGRTIAPCDAIAATTGNVIALAYDALAPDGKTKYNAISWISGGPPFRDSFETTTLAKLRALADLPQTDTAPESVIGAPMAITSRVDLLVMLLVGLVAGSVAIARPKRRTPADLM
jgi:hypothetical protein